MASFSVNVSAFAAGASLTYITVAAIIGAAGKRARLKSIYVACDGETAHDEAMSVKLNKTDNSTAGTAGVSPTPKQLDPDSAASIFTAGTSYSAEPTAYNSVSDWRAGFNGRGYIDHYFPDEDAPIILGARTLGLLVTGASATPRKVAAELIYEEF